MVDLIFNSFNLENLLLAEAIVAGSVALIRRAIHKLGFFSVSCFTCMKELSCYLMVRKVNFLTHRPADANCGTAELCLAKNTLMTVSTEWQ